MSEDFKLSHQPLPEANNKDESKVNRRVFTATTAGAIATGLLDRLFKNPRAVTESIARGNKVSAESEKEIPSVDYLKRDPETNQLTYSDVAEYFDAKFTGVKTPTNDNNVVIRTEPRAIEGNEMLLAASELNNRDIGVIRVASEYSNGKHDDPEFCFTLIEDNVPKRIYEWFALAKDTGDKNKPYVFVTPTGEVSDTPFYVGPNFVSRVSEDTDNDR